MDEVSQGKLSIDGCRVRQARLRHQLALHDHDAAIVCERAHVHYFTGYWCGASFAPIVLVPLEGPVTLCVPHQADGPLAAEEILVYPSIRLATMVEDQLAAAMGQIAPRLKPGMRIGCDAVSRPWLLPRVELLDLSHAIRALRRRKEPDELALMTVAIEAAEAAYHRARQLLRPGITEVELFAEMQAAAVNRVGEAIGEFGNDFRIGTLGSSPRRRAAEAGEMAIFDLSVVVRGYWSDLCRSFVVGGRASKRQQQAQERLVEVLEWAEANIRPGGSCRDLYQQAHAKLDGYEGWSFPHHLGHGVGLSGHETPRLNPHWEDRLELGDVVAIEPGLYGDELRSGLRIEDLYQITASGPVRLSRFPREIV